MSDERPTTTRPLQEPPSTGDPRLDALARLCAIVDRLRAPDGCPWDREQTLASMAPSLVEEAHEALEAIETEGDEAVVEELGDLLMVVTLIARIAQDERRFDLSDAARAVGDKLLRRHPHVFGELRVEESAQVLANWERIKQEERRAKQTDASALAGVPIALPALQRAQRLAAKAIAAGFRWSDARGALAKLDEELGELHALLDADDGGPQAAASAQAQRVGEELGDVLVAAAFLGHYLGLDPEQAARDALRRFERRFRALEAEPGPPLAERSGDELRSAWERAKRREP